jgi:hypothetical protein
MKLAFLAGAAAGYVLGARAGRERYESIVRIARKVAGSQTVQSTAGVLQAQIDDFAAKAKSAVGAKLPNQLSARLSHGPAFNGAKGSGGANGFRG